MFYWIAFARRPKGAQLTAGRPFPAASPFDALTLAQDRQGYAGEKNGEGVKGQVKDATDSVNTPSEPEVKKNPYNDDELTTTLTEIPKDELGCKPGYEWQRMSGVGCVQKDCSKIGAHYSYTKDCICGFVNPPPGAKTKVCKRPSNYLACPSCVFACVGADEECPEK